MQPHSFSPAEVAEFSERVYRTGVGGAGVGDHAKRAQSRRSVGGDIGAQRIHGETILLVTGNRPDLICPEADHPQRALNGRVRLIGEINGCAFRPIVEDRVARGYQGGHVRDRTAADKEPTRRVRHSTKAAQPLDHFQLQGSGGGASQPSAIEYVEPGGKHIRHGADEIAWPRHESEKARMRDVERVGKNVALQFVEQLKGIAGTVGWRRRQQGANFFRLGPGADRAIFHIGEMLDQDINHAVAEAPHLLGREFQILRRLGQCALHSNSACRG